MTRFLDIVLSASALVVLSPLLIVVMIVLKLTGEGEVFFVQQRVGRGGKMFGLYKFATMLKDSPNLGTGTVTLKNDPRVLPLGSFLRATKINELPQLLNILRGEMSLVGPRPQTLRCFGAFPNTSQMAIQSVRPGLTGIGSIVFRNEEEVVGTSEDANRLYDDVIMPYKGLLEEWFVRHRSLGLYIKIILLTVIAVFSPKSRVLRWFLSDLPEPPPSLQQLSSKVP